MDPDKPDEVFWMLLTLLSLEGAQAARYLKMDLPSRLVFCPINYWH